MKKIRKIPAFVNQNRVHSIACIGDSLTDPEANMGPEWTRWTQLLQHRLQAGGAFIKVRNMAAAGAKTDMITSKGMLLRILPFSPNPPTNDLLPRWNPIPDLVIIRGGTNDNRLITGVTRSSTTATYTSAGHGYSNGNLLTIVGWDQSQYNVILAAISNVTTNTFDITGISGSPATPGTSTGSSGHVWSQLDTTTHLRALVRYCQFGCRGTFASQSSLPTDGIDGDRYVILYDTDSTGGRAAINSTQLPTIAGSAPVGDPTAWEFRSGQTGVSGWGRVGTHVTTPTHVSRFLIDKQYFMNWSSGGDIAGSPPTEYYPYSSGSPQGLRALQVAAVTGENNPNVVLVDSLAYFNGKILDGTETQGSFSYHIADVNVHQSELGHSYYADNIFKAIAAQPGWLTALSQ